MARVVAHEDRPVALLDRPVHLSFSQLTALTGISKYSCARRWGYEKRLGLPFVGSPALCAGSAVDEGISAFFAARLAGHEVSSASDLAATAAEDAWERAVAGARLPEPLEAAKDQAYRRAVGAGLGLFIGTYGDVLPAAVQQRHEYTVRSSDGQRARMVLGFSDWIAPDGTIVDDKVSGSPRWTGDGEWDADWVAEKRIQLAGYWLARRAEERRGDRLAAPVVPRGRLVVIYVNTRLRTPQLRELDLEFDDDDEARVLEAIRRADAVAVSGVYPARPGQACQFCSHVARCRDDFAARSHPFADEVGVPEPL